MQRSFEEKRAKARDLFDKRFCQLEEWTTRLIRAAKKVESLRRECKAIRQKVGTLTDLINAVREREKEERRAKKAAAADHQGPAAPLPWGELGPDDREARGPAGP